MNVVAGHEDDPVAILIRALQPTEGLDLMCRRRSRARRDTELCSGPAKLTEAMAIDRLLDGSDTITSPQIWLERLRQRTMAASRIGVGPRVGVEYTGKWARRPLRFVVRNDRYLSRRY